MSTLTIELVEIKVVGTEDKRYGFIASDDYGSIFDLAFNSLEEFKEMHPDRKSVLQYIVNDEAFKDSFQLSESSGEVTYGSINWIELVGFEDDNSVTFKE